MVCVALQAVPALEYESRLGSSIRYSSGLHYARAILLLCTASSISRRQHETASCSSAYIGTALRNATSLQHSCTRTGDAISASVV